MRSRGTANVRTRKNSEHHNSAPENRIPASAVHEETAQRYGKAYQYQTPGYYLRIYRLRGELTQAQLAERTGMKQHHLSEMEHNKRPIGKALARRLAHVLGCPYQRLL